jgi:hypothetical protein
LDHNLKNKTKINPMSSMISKGNKFAKLNSKSLLELIAKGNMKADEAKMAAEIVERRFPTPQRTRH